MFALELSGSISCTTHTCPFRQAWSSGFNIAPAAAAVLTNNSFIASLFPLPCIIKTLSLLHHAQRANMPVLTSHAGTLELHPQVFVNSNFINSGTSLTSNNSGPDNLKHTATSPFWQAMCIGVAPSCAASSSFCPSVLGRPCKMPLDPSHVFYHPTASRRNGLLVLLPIILLREIWEPYPIGEISELEGGTLLQTGFGAPFSAISKSAACTSSVDPAAPFWPKCHPRNFREAHWKQSLSLLWQHRKFLAPLSMDSTSRTLSCSYCVGNFFQAKGGKVS